MTDDGALVHRIVVAGRSDGPHLLVTGGVHGDEFEPMAAVRQLRRRIAPSDLRGRVTLVPVVNESAFRRGERCGADGRDLARTCPGAADGSITERIAAILTVLIRSADHYIDLHTGGTRYQVMPLAGYMLHADARVLDVQRRMARAFNLPIVWGTTPALEGRSLSVARDAGVPAIYTERAGGACERAGVEAYVEGCLNVMALVGMIDRSVPPSRIEHVVEDDRPGSGHLQVQNQAPFDGFFEPDVRLGDRLQAGDSLGTVTDTLGDRVEAVRAREAGLVLALRTLASVAAGESVGVVLAIDRDRPDRRAAERW
jgi:predicted deacylase